MLATAKPIGDPLAFYEIAATVIPVLFLAIVYQARVVRRVPSAMRFGAAQLPGLVALVGEIDAFQVLANRQPSLHAQHGISAVLLVLGLIIVAEPLVPVLPHNNEIANENYARLRAAGVPEWQVTTLRFVASRAFLPLVIACGGLAGILSIYGAL